MEIILCSDKSTEFKPLPKRWIVERTFAWLQNFRRLAKDFEYKESRLKRCHDTTLLYQNYAQ
ncbi:MAG: hypothetical protein LBP85_06260 [Prevotellaceae bacterium]|jgi:transposase|nr:hypothetical protein [Prevotellaceae bacterium]